MEREMCGYLEWNLNVQGEEVLAFEAAVRAEHGAKALSKASSSSHSSDGSITVSAPGPSAYPTPDTTPDPRSRPIRPVPSPYKNKASYQHHIPSAPPSPPASPAYRLHSSHQHSPAPTFTASASSSLASSPASDDCKTPSPVALASTSSTYAPPKSLDMTRAFEASSRQRQHSSGVNLAGYSQTMSAW
jgi:hypothetical protein